MEAPMLFASVQPGRPEAPAIRTPTRKALFLCVLCFSFFFGATHAASSVPAPSNVSATAASETAIALSWTDNSLNERFFRIERSLSPTDGFVRIGRVHSGTTTYLDEGLSPATTYYFRIRAVRKKAASAYSN